MDKVMDKVKEMPPKRLGMAAGALVFLKLFGVGKTLFFLFGGVAGFLFANHFGCEKQKDEE